jgi:hypothetical protein
MRGLVARYAYRACDARKRAGQVALVMAAAVVAACALANPGLDADASMPPLAQSTLPSVRAATPTTLPTPASSGGMWRPEPGQSWQWQLSDLPVDTSVAADIYDLDLFETSPTTVAQLHARGRHAICYLSAGSFEEWRPDAGLFPHEVIGRAYAGWPGEWWLDIREMELLAPILEARLDLCQAKGFDGVEPDNIDAYQSATGFPLSAQDQLLFNRWLASEAHARGLAIGLKNDPDQAHELADDYDWALLEDCFAQGWCEALAPFSARGKLVVAVEYTDSGVDWQEACSQASRLGFNLVLKNRELDAWRQTCEEQ